jgi:hypothetical protein
VYTVIGASALLFKTSAGWVQSSTPKVHEAVPGTGAGGEVQKPLHLRSGLYLAFVFGEVSLTRVNLPRAVLLARRSSRR